MKGKDFEKEVDRFNKNFMKDYLVYHQADFPYFAVSRENTKFTPPSLPDFVYLHKSLPQYVIECKYTISERFAFKNLRSRQHQFLEKFNSFAGTSFVLLGFTEEVISYLISYENYKKIEFIKKQRDLKSINCRLDKELLEMYGFRCERVRLRTKYYIYLSKLLT